MFTKFNRLSTCALLAAAAVGTCGSIAAADVFTFTYTDTNGVVASGNLVANPTGPNYTCVSGDMTVTAGPGGVTLGYFTLVPGSGVTANFYWDNILQGGPSTLTISGLLFNNGSIETNIWGNGGATNYSFWQAPPQWAYAGEAIGTFEISPTVPTPGAAALAGIGLMASTRRRRG